VVSTIRFSIKECFFFLQQKKVWTCLNMLNMP
jgi:hypothetical protein